MNHPKLQLTSVSTATSYYFSTLPRSYGWAICTVNDVTGELNVMSDWGNWSHRWNTDSKCLGQPTLTHFISTRDSANYLADKLWSDGYGGRVFDAHATCAKFRKQICSMRLEHHRGFTESIARDLYDELGGDLADAGSSDLFMERFYNIDGASEWLSEHVWEELERSQSPMYRVLLESILPALIEACANRVANRPETSL